MKKLSDRQNQILDSALTLIAEGGIQAVTIKNLSKKIGLVESAIYRHFGSKSEILEALLVRFNQKSVKAMTRMREQESSGLNQLEKFVLNKFKNIADDPVKIAFIFSEKYFLNNEVLQNRIVENMEMIQNEIQRMICDAQENNEIRNDFDARYISQLIMGSIRFTATKWRLSNYGFDLFEEGKEMWGTIKKMMERNNK